MSEAFTAVGSDGRFSLYEIEDIIRKRNAVYINNFNYFKRQFDVRGGGESAQYGYIQLHVQKADDDYRRTVYIAVIEEADDDKEKTNDAYLFCDFVSGHLSAVYQNQCYFRIGRNVYSLCFIFDNTCSERSQGMVCRGIGHI